MKSYHRTKIIVVSFFFSYLLLTSVPLAFHHEEIFPFFSWNLFSLVPEETSHYAVRITHVNGKKLNLPVFYENADSLVQRPHSIVPYYLIQQFGAAHAKNDTISREQVRYVFDENYLESPMEYELVQLKYFPLERWNTGKMTVIPIQKFVAYH